MRKYVNTYRRTFEKNGKKHSKAPKIQRLVTPLTLQVRWGTKAGRDGVGLCCVRAEQGRLGWYLGMRAWLSRAGCLCLLLAAGTGWHAQQLTRPAPPNSSLKPAAQEEKNLGQEALPGAQQGAGRRVPQAAGAGGCWEGGCWLGGGGQRLAGCRM